MVVYVKLILFLISQLVMKIPLALSFVILFSLGTMHAWAEPAPQVLVMGTFHFKNPKLDVIKTEQLDVMEESEQEYLEKLAKQLSQFKPTVVMLEYGPKKHDAINKEYQDYLKGNFKLKANEIYQIGFRLAKMAGLKEVHSFDEQNIHWQGDKLNEYMKRKDLSALANYEQTITDWVNKIGNQHKTLNLQELLIEANDEKIDRTNMGLYLLTNAVGAEDNFIGADTTASWWHRNFRMYARIQNKAKPDARIFVLGGQGHTAILRQLVNIDSRIEEEPVLSYLELEYSLRPSQ